VEALGRATSSMRAKLGESLSTIQGENHAYQQALTTSSLEALQAFYMGDEEWTRTGNRQAAISFYRHATELDPSFAFAFAVLGAQQFYAGDAEQGKEAIEKAYALEDRVSERERLFMKISATTFLETGGKLGRSTKLLARRYPRDPVFHSNLGFSYIDAGEPEKALSEGQAAIRTARGFSRATALRAMRCWN